MIPVSECLSEDGSVCGWYGMCSSKGVKMCQIEGKDRQNTIRQRIKFAEGCLNRKQTEALEGLLSAIS